VKSFKSSNGAPKVRSRIQQGGFLGVTWGVSFEEPILHPKDEMPFQTLIELEGSLKEGFGRRWY